MLTTEAILAKIGAEWKTPPPEMYRRQHAKYDDREAQMIIGSTWEGIQSMFGMDKEGHNEMVRELGSDTVSQLKEQHEAALNG